MLSVVLSTSLNPLRFNELLYWYNLINRCGSVSPAINEGKEVGLLRHNIKNAIHNYYPERKQSLTIEFTDCVKR
jgi:hypothetical protein